MIYALADMQSLRQRGLSLQKFLSSISSLDVPMLQYRNKTGSIEEQKADLELIRNRYRGSLIVNDMIELISYADGIHLGQEDMLSWDKDKQTAVAMIRKIIGHKILGLSTHNLAEIQEANTLEIDYIGLGAYRTTETKKDASVGGDTLPEMAKHSTHPVAIIGGVRMDDRFEKPICYKVIGSGLYAL